MDITQAQPPPLQRLRWYIQDLRADLRAIVRSHELVRYLTSASLKSEHSSTVFGSVWWVLDPLLLMAIYVLLVKVIFERGGENYPVFVFAAILPWKWFTAAVVNSVNFVVGKERLIKQVAFPKAVLPISASLGATVHFCAGLLVLLVLSLPFGIYPHPVLLFLPVVMGMQLMFTLGVAFFLSAVNVFFRDVKNLVTYVLRLWFYLSPGLYAVDRIPEEYRGLYYLNPFVSLFTAYRDIVMEHVIPDPATLVALAVVSLGTLAAGYLFFQRTEPWFAKVV